MLSKKSIKLISIVLLAVALLATVACTATFAAPTPDTVTPTSLEGPVKTILGIIRWAGIVVAVIIAMFLGIKYITASPDGKAEIKKTLALYVGGIALLLSASAVVTFLETQLGGTGNSGNSTNP